MTRGHRLFSAVIEDPFPKAGRGVFVVFIAPGVDNQTSAYMNGLTWQIAGQSDPIVPVRYVEPQVNYPLSDPNLWTPVDDPEFLDSWWIWSTMHTTFTGSTDIRYRFVCYDENLIQVKTYGPTDTFLTDDFGPVNFSEAIQFRRFNVSLDIDGNPVYTAAPKRPAVIDGSDVRAGVGGVWGTWQMYAKAFVFSPQGSVIASPGTLLDGHQWQDRWAADELI